MKFFGRKMEIEIIQKAIKRRNCFVVLTGRRRIGKTRLVREALKDMEHIELFIPRKRAALAIESLRESIEVQTGFAPTFGSIREMFEYLFRNERVPIFVDEISNLKRMGSGVFSDLQELIDRNKENWRIRLVVDGSYVEIMKRIFRDSKEPLFGRATDMIELQPLPTKDAVCMCMEGGFGFTDALEAHSLLGGVPRYLELIPDYDDMGDLADRIFSQGSIFLTEGENVLVQEFGASWDTYFSILEVIAGGAIGPSAIASQLDMKVMMVPKYLATLTELQLIRRFRPVLGKERHVRYHIRDPFFQFWFGICYPRLEQYRDGTMKVPPERVRASVGAGMERVVADIFYRENLLPFEPTEIGGWWDRSGHEIDFLAYSKSPRSIAAGEVKWTNRKVTPDVVKKLLENLALVDWHNGLRKEYAFIVSRSGFMTPARKLMEEKGVLGLGIKDLEKVLFEGKRLEWSPLPS